MTRCLTCDSLALADPEQKDRWIRFLERQVERLLRREVADAHRSPTSKPAGDTST